MDYPFCSSQFTSQNFVISCGSVLFRGSPSSDQLQVCILHTQVTETQKEKYVLPKGRKDLSEPTEVAAIRETFEETGYPCELLPLRMPTRAPEPNINMKDVAREVDGATEPVMVTFRELPRGQGCKVIWWYVARLKGGNTVEKIEGTQTESEHYESEFFDVAVAMGKLSFNNDRDVVKEALRVVLANKVKDRGLDVMFP